LTPLQVERLCAQHDIEIVVQTSDNRVFPDVDFESAGARVSKDLSDCDVILGVKEIPVAVFQADKAYLFFAHVIKGQPYNMPMLRRMLELNCTLIDYEKIIDDRGARLIAFGRFAGIAGMIDTLWALGQRLDREGIQNPFSDIRRAIDYENLESAKRAIEESSRRIKAEGIPRALFPIVCGFAGYGNVSQGAQEILGALPVREIEPAALNSELPNDVHHVYKVVFKEEHLVEPIAAADVFELQDYYGHPEKYRSCFEGYLPYLTVLMNCVYWDARYPRLVTRKNLDDLQRRSKNPKLRVIGDISCDVEGAIEATLKTTEPGNPVYVYEPSTGEVRDGVEGHGPVILAVDILPTELPREASEWFGAALSPFVPALLRADYSVRFEALDLPPVLKRAVVAHQGRLTPDYRYIAQFLGSNGV
jgi:alpha-aminoadipic semialdehyde synthase